MFPGILLLNFSEPFLNSLNAPKGPIVYYVLGGGGGGGGGGVF